MILGLMAFHALILMYIFGRYENASYSVNRKNAERKAWHFLNMWLTGFNLMIGLILYNILTIESWANQNMIMVFVTVFGGIVSVPLQALAIMRFIFDSAASMMNYFMKRD